MVILFFFYYYYYNAKPATKISQQKLLTSATVLPTATVLQDYSRIAVLRYDLKNH